MVGQEGAAEQAAQKRLKADPFHQAVKIRVPGAETDRDLILPAGFGILQGMQYLFGGIVFFKNAGNAFFALFRSQKDDVVRPPAGSQGNRLKTESAHGFLSCRGGMGRTSGISLVYGPGVRKGASFSEERFHSGIKSSRRAARPRAAHDIIDPAVGTVPLLVKGHGGADKNSVPVCADAVEHGGYIPMVPDVVRAAPVDGDGSVRRQILHGI